MIYLRYIHVNQIFKFGDDQLQKCGFFRLFIRKCLFLSSTCNITLVAMTKKVKVSSLSGINDTKHLYTQVCLAKQCVEQCCSRDTRQWSSDNRLLLIDKPIENCGFIRLSIHRVLFFVGYSGFIYICCASVFMVFVVGPTREIKYQRIKKALDAY